MGADAMRKRAKQDFPLVIGLAWYRTEDWSTLKAMFPDGDQLHGSSLGPEVIKATFGRVDGLPELHVLDSTDPAQVRAIESKVDLLLGREQLLEPLGCHAIERPLGPAAELLGGGRRGGMIDHVLRELDRAAAPSLDCAHSSAG
jgi:hypothetical protein